jgi:hypothetical protein
MARIRRMIHHATMKRTMDGKEVAGKLEQHFMTYLLWTRENTAGTASVMGIYFPSTSGISYDGEGKFWELPWSMWSHRSDTLKDALAVFYEKIKEKVSEGYETIAIKSCVDEEEANAE